MIIDNDTFVFDEKNGTDLTIAKLVFLFFNNNVNASRWNKKLHLMVYSLVTRFALDFKVFLCLATAR